MSPSNADWVDHSSYAICEFERRYGLPELRREARKVDLLLTLVLVLCALLIL